MVKLQELLNMQIQHNASDLILKVGSPPIVRVNGDLTTLTLPPLTEVDIESGIVELLKKEDIAEYKKNSEIDISYQLSNASRFRINLFRQKGKPGAVFRHIPSKIPTLGELGFPKILKQITLRPRGLIVVTGPSGCGKSTTQAALLNHRNANDTCHIVTVEDPVEFIHQNIKALVTQREVGRDTHSFSNALKFVLRQDPDVIFVGEMRDLETISLAITAAETGHTVITTLHPSLSLNLLGIISQNLLKRTDGNGRVAAYEILIATHPVRNLIREAKTHQLASILQSSQQQGMISFDACLASFVKKGIVAIEEAESKALSRDTLRKELEQTTKSGK